MERASEGSRFNQTGCGHSTASATAFVPNAESRQRPAIEQRCSRTKEPNEAIGVFLFFFNILVQNTHTIFIKGNSVLLPSCPVIWLHRLHIPRLIQYLQSSQRLGILIFFRPSPLRPFPVSAAVLTAPHFKPNTTGARAFSCVATHHLYTFASSTLCHSSNLSSKPACFHLHISCNHPVMCYFLSYFYLLIVFLLFSVV